MALARDKIDRIIGGGLPFDTSRSIDKVMREALGGFDDPISKALAAQQEYLKVRLGSGVFPEASYINPIMKHLEEIDRQQRAELSRLHGPVVDKAMKDVMDALVGAKGALFGAGLPDRSWDRLIETRGAIHQVYGAVFPRMDSLTPLVNSLTRPADPRQGAIARELDAVQALLSGTRATRSALRPQDYPNLFPELRRPTLAELAGVDLAGAVGGLARARPWRERTIAEMAAVESPWVRDDDPGLAIEAYGVARALTEMVESEDPSSRRVIQAARDELGDYREEDQAAERETDLVLLSGRRLARGFDPRLGELSLVVMQSILGPFGMIGDETAAADPAMLDEIVSSMVRPVERKLRAFLQAAMERQIGAAWIKQRVPANVREGWEAKRQADIDNLREAGDLFDYADFSDYRALIERNDNWRDVFEAIFKKRPAIVEALNRLATVRNPVAHVRPLSVDDLLIAATEGRRLMKWMGITRY